MLFLLRHAPDFPQPICRPGNLEETGTRQPPVEMSWGQSIEAFAIDLGVDFLKDLDQRLVT